ncbi:MAG: efflux RND transporter periplasmic adaptor subunit [Bacteroidetes bacterium]|nr:efflux RND transporter periplasmic adaptor subunit [Bacteroidota bacterium]
MKRIFLVVTVFCIGTACKNQKVEVKQNAGSQKVMVDVIVAKTQKISNIIEANGTVLANEYAELHPEVNGRLVFLDVPEGTVVKKGTVIAKINDADLQAQLSKTKVQLNLAELTEQRYKKLLNINGINQNDYDIALNQVNSFKADLAYTQTLIDKTVLKAPFDGLLGLRLISQGSFVTTATVLTSIQQVSKLKIDFTLPENYSNLIRKGRTVEVDIDGGKSARKKATIFATEPMVNTATRNLKVRAYLNATANPGAFVKIYLDAGENSKSIMVPSSSIMPEAKSKRLAVVKNGKSVFVDVETGVRTVGAVEILSGINVGDSIIVTGILFTRQNGLIKIRSVKNIEDLIR